MIPSGYTHAAYAASLAEFGTPRQLPGCGGWVLERGVPGGDEHDLMGCYPLFACLDWRKLAEDLQLLGPQWISLACVTDPFGSYNVEELQACFPDVLTPFKTHYVIDLTKMPQNGISRHHRYYARRAMKNLEVEVHPNPPGFLPMWLDLYRHLIDRHQLKGIRAFSTAAFAGLLEMADVTILWAHCARKPMAAQIWISQGEVIYSHLAAATPEGYQQFAFYALYACAIEYFKDRASWLDLGSGAGLHHHGKDGLSQFKRGWANDTRRTYFGGRIINSARYWQLSRKMAFDPVGYFPAYRQGEFS